MSTATAILDAQHDSIVQAFADALDTMGFMFADLAEEVPAVPDEAVRIRMHFRASIHTDLAGIFEMNASRTFAALLTANVLGCDPIDLDDEAINDCAKELINVAVGAFTPLLSDDPDETFTLTPPSYETIGEEDWQEALFAEGTVSLISEGEPVVVRVIVE
ncbi:MAG: chemotaxis protein CheX [Planctomycetota bacterium]